MLERAKDLSDDMDAAVPGSGGASCGLGFAFACGLHSGCGGCSLAGEVSGHERQARRLGPNSEAGKGTRPVAGTKASGAERE